MSDPTESVTADLLTDYRENWEDYIDWEIFSQMQSDSDQNGLTDQNELIGEFCLASYGSLNAARQR